MSNDTHWAAEANKYWKQVFDDGPYTSWKMLEYLIGKAGIDYTAYLKNPKGSLKGIKQIDIWNENINSQPIVNTWNSHTGRCTSFACKVVTLLNAAHPDQLKLKLYALGGHRVGPDGRRVELSGHRIARCEKTGILIDSSSSKGGFILHPNQKHKFENPEDTDDWQEWQYISGESNFVNAKNEERQTSLLLTIKQSMAVCLLEVAAASTQPLLFRSIGKTDQLPKYHGCLVWVLAKQRLEMLPNSGDKKNKYVIEFGSKSKKPSGKAGDKTDPSSSAQGNDQTNEDCIVKLVEFVRYFGGTNALRQWHSDGIDEFVFKMWDAAVAVWGKPIHFTEGNPVKPAGVTSETH